MFFLVGLDAGDTGNCLGKRARTETINKEQVIDMENNERKHCSHCKESGRSCHTHRFNWKILQ